VEFVKKIKNLSESKIFVLILYITSGKI